MLDLPDRKPLEERAVLRLIATREAGNFELVNGDGRDDSESWYLMLDPEAVEERRPETYVAALASREVARMDLGLRRAGLRWYQTTGSAWRAGWALMVRDEVTALQRSTDSALGLHSDQDWIATGAAAPAPVAASNVFHEMRHVWQEGQNVTDREADAHEYQREAFRRFWPRIQRVIQAETGTQIRTPLWALETT